MGKKPLKERFQTLAGISLTEQSSSACDEVIYLAECSQNCLGADWGEVDDQGNLYGAGLITNLQWYPYTIQQILNYLETGTIATDATASVTGGI